jgi:hypothetical protein
VKNGSFDIAYRTMTIGLLMLLVLSIVSVGILNLRPGSGTPVGPMAGNAVAPVVAADSARSDELRREFASSLELVSDRLSGIEQRFSTLTPPAVSGAPTVEDARLQSAIESTQRRLEHLGDRLTDRIQSVSVGSEVELRDLNRQLSQMLDEQQQIQEQMVSVRVAAENRLRPTRLTRTRDDQNATPAKNRTAQNRQDRLTENLEAMVSELASLREQLQSVRVAAANIEPADERVAISRKIPQDVSSASSDREPETPLDLKVPEPSDLDVAPQAPVSTEASVVETSNDNSGSAATELPAPVESPSAVPVTPAETLDETIELPSVSEPQSSTIQTPRETTTITKASPDNDWEVPIAARPVSTIFPVDKRPGISTQTPRGKSLPSVALPAGSESSAIGNAADRSGVRISLPAPTPLASNSAEPSLPAPLPFPVAVAEIAEPTVTSVAKPTVAEVAADSPQVTPQEPRRLSREIPTGAQRAPLRLADAPVVRPFEVPTHKPDAAQRLRADSQDDDAKTSDSPFSRFALTSSNSPTKPSNSSRGIKNAKWRAARDNADDNGPQPTLRDSRSLFPIFRGKSSGNDASPVFDESGAADSQIPQPISLPRNLIESSANDRVSAPPLIEQASAELAGPQRRFTVQASVLHITANDLTTVDRAGVKMLAVMGGHDFRVDQIRHAVRESEAADEIYSGTVTITGGVPTRIPIGWLCPHCNEESGVTSGDQLVVTLPHGRGNSSASFYVEQADGTGRSESFRDATATLIPGASVQITEAAQDGTVETSESTSTPVLSRLPVIGEKFEKKETERQIMQRVIVLTIREIRDAKPQAIQQLSGQTTAAGSKVVHADMTAPAARATRPTVVAADSSGATAVNAGVANRRPAPPVED